MDLGPRIIDGYLDGDNIKEDMSLSIDFKPSSSFVSRASTSSSLCLAPVQRMKERGCAQRPLLTTKPSNCWLFLR